MDNGIFTSDPGLKERSERVLSLLMPLLPAGRKERTAISVCGCSGAGKSTLARALAELLSAGGMPALVIGGDDYPHRVPAQNDAERLRIFRENGFRAALSAPDWGSEAPEELRTLWRTGTDADPSVMSSSLWKNAYFRAGRSALADYLGTPEEADFDMLSRNIRDFKAGAPVLWLRKLGREPETLTAERTEVSAVRVLIIEWTHAGSEYLTGPDRRIMIRSTPEETLLSRLKRNRDAGAASPFTALVLSLEQEKLDAALPRMDLTVDRDGHPLL